MKKLALLLSFAFVTGAAFANAQSTAYGAKAPAKAETKAAAKPAAAAKTHPVEAEFVSADAAKKTVTLKVGADTSTSPLEGRAITQVKALKAGEKVTAMCKDDAEGKHLAVVSIRKAAAMAKAPAAAKAPAK